MNFQQQNLLLVKFCNDHIYVLKGIISLQYKLTVFPLRCFLGTPLSSPLDVLKH